MGIKLVKKTQEKLTKLPTVEKDLVYVPGFTNEKGLIDLVADIQAQYKEAQNSGDESGWDGDANAWKLPDAMKALDFKYLLTIGASDVVFAFTSKADRDCIINDYLPDPEAW